MANQFNPLRIGATPRIIYVLYLALFSVLGHQITHASKVHSRYGLAFTGIVQLCCSTVMSFSILTLMGWSGGTLPTYILPFVIVVVGAENMSSLTRAVFSVPFKYSVPVRIGIALSRVGSTISIVSFSDLVLLGLVWLVVKIPPVREFCVFAAVLIVTDWFMLHTFFLTVLSIDAQRLELADVLAEAPPVQERPSSWRNLLSARMAKGGSMMMLLGCVGLIYYLTERPQADSASMLWRMINPAGKSILVRIPDAILLFSPKSAAPTSLGYPGWTIRFGPLLSLIEVAVLPQLVTAGLLYALLLYLLKDADLLDAQRNRLNPEEEASDMSMTLFPCGESDIDFIRSSADGAVILTVSMGSAMLWRSDGTREDIAESVLDAAISPDGLLLAIATDKTRVYKIETMDLVETVEYTGRLAFDTSDPFRRPRLLVANRDGIHNGRTITTEPGHLLDGGIFITVGKSVKLWLESPITLCSTPDAVRDATRLDSIVAIAWQSGLIEVFDTSSQLLTSTRHKGVRKVLLASATARCSTCSSSLGGFYIISTSDICQIELASRSSCRCRDTNTSPQRSPLLTPSDFPISSHGTRRLSALHHPSELELSTIGTVPAVRGGAAVLGDTCIVLHRSGKGVGDQQFSTTLIDLTTTSLTTRTVNLHDIIEMPDTPIGIQEKRRERLRSKSGRRSFPSFSARGSSGMAYVSVESLVKAGNKVLGGFGNRLGVIKLKDGVRRKRAASTMAIEVPPTPQQATSGMLKVPDQT